MPLRRACEACRAVKRACDGENPCAWCTQQQLNCRRLERRPWGSTATSSSSGKRSAKAKAKSQNENTAMIGKSTLKAKANERIALSQEEELPSEMPPDILIEACAMAACFHFEVADAAAPLEPGSWYCLDGSALVAMAVLAEELCKLN